MRTAFIQTHISGISLAHTFSHTEFASLHEVEGPRLYKKLREYDEANSNTSYLNKWWFETYLKDRRPIAINSNPQITFQSDPNPEKNTQLQVSSALDPPNFSAFFLLSQSTCVSFICKRASAMVTAAVRFLRTLEAGRMSPDVYHVRPKPEWFDSVMAQIPPGYTSVDPKEAVSLHTEVANRCGAFPLDMHQFGSMFRSNACCMLVTRLIKMMGINRAALKTFFLIVQHVQVDKGSKARHGCDCHAANCERKGGPK